LERYDSFSEFLYCVPFGERPASVNTLYIVSDLIKNILPQMSRCLIYSANLAYIAPRSCFYPRQATNIHELNDML